MRMLKRWWKKRREVRVVLARAGTLTDRQLTMGLKFTPDSLLMRSLAEIRGRLEETMMEDAFSGNDSSRLQALARIEGVNEFYKNILVFRDAPVVEEEK
jgi:hypothetical protein